LQILTYRLTDPFKIWWPTSDSQGLLPEMFKFTKIQDGGHLRFIQIPIAFKPLDRSFQNLVVNFGQTRARIVKKIEKSKMATVGGHFGFFKSL
jgi:hypothetical protein